MLKQITSKRYTLLIPVSIEIRLLKDKTLIAKNETEIKRIIDETFLHLLEEKRELGNLHILNEEFKDEVSAYIDRELLPKKLVDSPAHQPDILIEIKIKGNITTWKREPEEMKN